MNTLQKLNASEVIVVLVDLQPEILKVANKTIVEATLLQAVSIFIEGANILDIPVFISGVKMQPDKDLKTIDELVEYPVMIRSTAGVFDDDTSLKAIASYKKPVIVLGGVATELAVVQAALGALRNGFDVYLLTDVCGGLSGRTEQAAFRQLEKAGATLSSVAAFLSSLMPPPIDPRANSLFATLARFFA